MDNYQNNIQLKLKCKAAGCTENHSLHFCKNCNNSDSDHKSANCVNKISSQSKRCKASNSGCLENHSQHFCKNCKNDNSDHKSADCPETACDICSMERKSHSIIDGNLCCNGRNALFVKK